MFQARAAGSAWSLLGPVGSSKPSTQEQASLMDETGKCMAGADLQCSFEHLKAECMSVTRAV